MLAAIVLPSWLTDEHAITVATWGLVFVTFLLVVATIVLWLDSRSKGEEQRDRWHREDLKAAGERKPKYQFGLKATIRTARRVSFSEYVPEPAIHLWIANLGQSGLYIDKFYIKHRDFQEGVLNVNEMVKAGDQLKFDIPDQFWQKVPGHLGSSDGVYLFGDHEIWLSMSDASADFETERIIYTLSYMQRSFDKLERRSHEDRQPSCGKCGAMVNAVLPATKALTERELTSWPRVLEDLVASCPNHHSDLLRDLNGPPDWIIDLMRKENA